MDGNEPSASTSAKPVSVGLMSCALAALQVKGAHPLGMSDGTPLTARDVARAIVRCGWSMVQPAVDAMNSEWGPHHTVGLAGMAKGGALPVIAGSQSAEPTQPPDTSYLLTPEQAAYAQSTDAFEHAVSVFERLLLFDLVMQSHPLVVQQEEDDREAQREAHRMAIAADVRGSTRGKGGKGAAAAARSKLLASAKGGRSPEPLGGQATQGLRRPPNARAAPGAAPARPVRTGRRGSITRHGGALGLRGMDGLVQDVSYLRLLDPAALSVPGASLAEMQDLLVDLCRMRWSQLCIPAREKVALGLDSLAVYVHFQLGGGEAEEGGERQ